MARPALTAPEATVVVSPDPALSWADCSDEAPAVNDGSVPVPDHDPQIRKRTQSLFKPRELVQGFGLSGVGMAGLIGWSPRQCVGVAAGLLLA